MSRRSSRIQISISSASIELMADMVPPGAALVRVRRETLGLHAGERAGGSKTTRREYSLAVGTDPRAWTRLGRGVLVAVALAVCSSQTAALPVRVVLDWLEESEG